MKKLIQTFKLQTFKSINQLTNQKLNHSTTQPYDNDKNGYAKLNRQRT